MSTTETQEEIKTYVWSKTERAGDIVTVDKTEGEFTVFTDGSRIFTNMVGEMLMEAKNPTEAFNLAQPFLSAANDSGPGGPKEVEETKSTNKPTNTTSEVNVMLEMLRKISAKNTISMPLELNVPSKEVYELFKDQMDITKADLNQHILELVQSQIDNLQEQLKPQAEEFIKTYYNGKRTRKVSATDKGATRSDRSGGNSAPDITY